jgi:ureidoglycolate lyase
VVQLPFELRELERHPLASQLFMPLDGCPFPVVVATRESTTAAADLRAFMSDGRQGVCLNPGTWHHHQLTLESASEYLVIERRGDEGNLEQLVLDAPVWLCDGAD